MGFGRIFRILAAASPVRVLDSFDRFGFCVVCQGSMSGIFGFPPWRGAGFCSTLRQ